jgi:hypothetical protein
LFAITNRLLAESRARHHVRRAAIEEKQMKYALIGAAAFAASALATPALAQAVIDDPGYCAQYYPNANCQNLGPGNPYTNGISPDDWHNGNDWHNRQAAMVHHHHRHHHRHPR